MTFCLTLLGTTCEHKPYEIYPRGDTLGIIHDAIEEPKKILNGPVSLGSDVGDIIADAVITLLEQIEGGETCLTIQAHSRGAVEAILVTHELYRLQVLCREGSIDFWANTQTTPCLLTKAGYTKQKGRIAQISERQSPAFYNALLAHAIHLFLLDPVPGGNWFGAPIGWQDTRMYELPPNVASCEEIVVENERTRGFKAIVPKAVDSSVTYFRWYSLYGNHGTIQGNPFDQKGNPAPKTPKYDDNFHVTLHVQNVTLLHLYEFLVARGVRFDFSVVTNRIVGERRDHLVDMMLDYKQKGYWERMQFLLECYHQIEKCRDIFLKFNNTNYVYLGLEGDHRRYIHYHSKADSFLQENAAVQSPDEFVNSRHYELYEESLLHELGLSYLAANFEPNLLMTQVTRLQTSITSLLSHFLDRGRLIDGSKRKALVMTSPSFQKKIHQHLQHLLEAIGQELASPRVTEVAKKEAVYSLDTYVDYFAALKLRNEIDVEYIRLIDELHALLQTFFIDFITCNREKIRERVEELNDDYEMNTLNLVNQYYCESSMFHGLLSLMGRILRGNNDASQLKEETQQYIGMLLNAMQNKMKVSVTPMYLRQSADLLVYQQKQAKIHLIAKALNAYLTWCETHAMGMRTQHVFHGATGRQRAEALLEQIQRYHLLTRGADVGRMNAFFEHCHDMILSHHGSGNRRHSLSRYVYAELFSDAESEKHAVHHLADRQFAGLRGAITF